MVFKVSTLFISIFVILGLVSPTKLESISQNILNIISTNFGWLYMFVMLGVTIFCVYLAFSKFSNIKLGKDDDEPEFSNITWYAMLFSAGMGVGLLFYGIGEPISHFMSPAPGVAETSIAQARAALRYSFFHWGIHAWALYAFVGLAMAYFMYRKESKNLISSSLSPLLKNKSNSSIGNFIDIISIISVVFGIAASLGVGVLQISTGINYIFGIEQTTLMQIGIIVVLTSIYIMSSYTGLDKGIKWLSNTNLLIAVGLLLFVLFCGPTTFLLEVFTTTLGTYFDNFISTSLNLAPFTDSKWIRDWTLMYWAWWISWAPFVGIFIARVSKGRTIKEFIVSVVLVPSLFCFIWFSVFGGTGLYLEMFEGASISQAVANDISTATFETLSLLPMGKIISVIAFILVITFFITSADSATFVLGMLSSDGDLNPPVKKRIIWGVLQALIATVLLISGGIQSIQNVAIIFALPFALVVIAMCFSLYKALKIDYKCILKEKKKQEKEMLEVLTRVNLEMALDEKRED